MSDSGSERKAPREGEKHRPGRLAVRDEVSRLAADDCDLKEMRLIREQLAELAPPLSK